LEDYRQSKCFGRHVRCNFIFRTEKSLLLVYYIKIVGCNRKFYTTAMLVIVTNSVSHALSIAHFKDSCIPQVNTRITDRLNDDIVLSSNGKMSVPNSMKICYLIQGLKLAYTETDRASWFDFSQLECYVYGHLIYGAV
jgi:hypothetical protein